MFNSNHNTRVKIFSRDATSLIRPLFIIEEWPHNRGTTVYCIKTQEVGTHLWALTHNTYAFPSYFYSSCSSRRQHYKFYGTRRHRLSNHCYSIPCVCSLSVYKEHCCTSPTRYILLLKERQLYSDIYKVCIPTKKYIIK